MSEKREHEDDDKNDSSEDECIGPSLSEATETVEKKKRKGIVRVVSTSLHVHSVRVNADARHRTSYLFHRCRFIILKYYHRFRARTVLIQGSGFAVKQLIFERVCE